MERGQRFVLKTLSLLTPGYVLLGLGELLSHRVRAGGRLTRTLGRVGSVALMPSMVFGSLARRSRLFHPNGICFDARVEPLASTGALQLLAHRLKGRALVRVSSSWWKNEREWPDLLGMAVRFVGNASPADPQSKPIQDLLFITTRRLWRIPFALLTTNQHDFLDNHYFGGAPFLLPDGTVSECRLAPTGESTAGASRRERLEQMVQQGHAAWRLEMMPSGDGAWQPVVEIRLVERVEVDQDQLAFSPFNAASGIQPVGVVHALRSVAYPWSQRARAAVHP